jgi:exopolysaccharide biosynthesis polyprenyl glycosylphosphotransferase
MALGLTSQEGGHDTAWSPEELADAVGVSIESDRPKSLRRVLLTLDAAAAALAWFGVLLGPALMAGVPRRMIVMAVAATAAVLVTIAVMAGQKLYLARICSVRAVELQRTSRAVVMTSAGVYAAGRVLEVPIHIEAAVMGGFVAFVLLVSARTFFRSWLAAHRREGRYARPMVLIGANQDAVDLYRVIEDHPEMGYRISGVVARKEDAAALEVPWLGDIAEAPHVVHASGANGVLVVASAMATSQLNEVVRDLLMAGVHVHMSSGLQGIAHHRLRALPFAHEPLFYLERAHLARWQVMVKRTLDLGLASVAVVLVLPMLAAAALAIKLEDGGPLLFRQKRVGRNGEAFTLFKLRTMVPDAEQQLQALQERNQRMGPLFKLAADPRITSAGRILRATSIDELPQLFNVLQGTMSLVGPRPALPEEMQQFDDRLQARTQVPPGITGLWQVEARDNPSFGAYRRLDLFYVENWSVGLDLGILLATVGVVLTRGSRALRRAAGLGGQSSAAVLD